MVGLFTFSYASIHMLSYVGLDYRFDFQPLIDDVLKKKFIFIGFSAWLLLTVLALTSSNVMVRILKSNWKKLHRLVYVIAIFGSLHFIWLSKTIFFKPLIYSIIILILLSFRIKLKKNAQFFFGSLSTTKQISDLVKNLLPVPLSNENIPPIPFTASIVRSVCFHFSYWSSFI